MEKLFHRKPHHQQAEARRTMKSVNAFMGEYTVGGAPTLEEPRKHII